MRIDNPTLWDASNRKIQTWEVLSQIIVDNSFSSITFDVSDPKYSTYFIKIRDYTHSSTNSRTRLRVSFDGGVNFDSSGVNYESLEISTSESAGPTRTGVAGNAWFLNGIAKQNTRSAGFDVHIINLGRGSGYPAIRYTSTTYNTSSLLQYGLGAGVYRFNLGNILTHVRINEDQAGNIATGTVTLLGELNR